MTPKEQRTNFVIKSHQQKSADIEKSVGSTNDESTGNNNKKRTAKAAEISIM